MSDIELLEGYFTGPCNKCEGEVDVNDDVVALLVLETGDPMYYGLARSRHILPREGAKPCEGSPSRAQYLEGQPRDPRADYSYQEENETPMRELYDRLQKVAAALVGS